MKSIYLLCLFAFVFTFTSTAQTNQKKFDSRKLELGGSFGLSHGNGSNSSSYTSLQLIPQVGYRFSQKFSAGVGIGYIYRNWERKWEKDYTENYLGLGLYARLRPIKYIVLNVEPQLYRTWGAYYGSRFVGTLLLGGGVIIPVNNRSGFSIMLSYDVLQNKYSPYRDGWVYSIGYAIGF